MESLRLEIKRKLTARSDRVKCVDQHPTEPWLLCSLYSGDVNIWNYDTHAQIKRFEVCDQPVRAAKFVPRKNWVITGSDDMQIRVFNYNTLERVHAFEAHSDYVRCIAIHPTQPYILTSSDDLLIKLWNWDRNWACQQVFEGHTHYVMQVVINPKDNNTFASASLDATVKVWQLGSSSANFSLEGHEKGVNCVDYYHGGDKPYLISGADDRLVKIWDYQNKTCVQTLESHAQNVSAVCFHPEVPILLTGSEDGSIRIWHAGTYRLKASVNYGFERVWTISAMHGSNNVAIGYDEGTIMIKVGREEPAISMDVNGGKIIWAKHSDMQQVNLKALPEGTEIKDGERVPVVAKDLGACEIYPQTLAHNPNGRFVVVCGDGEYIIYTAMALRNKSFGNAQEFVWAFDSTEYATLENSSTIKVFKNFKEKKSFKPEYGAEGIFGGHMLGVKSISGMAFSFYDWDRLEHIRRIVIQPKSVYWAESGSLVCLATEEAYFVLKYNASIVAEARANNTIAEDGIENAFEVVGEVNEIVKTGIWVGDCFIYTNSVNRLNYYVGGEIVTITHLDHTMYILGYMAKENRLYLNDKELNIVSYSLLLSVLEYQTAVMRGDFETADRVLPTVPLDHRTRVAHFLEKQGFKQQALAVSTEPEHQFELALALGELERARQLSEEAAAAEGAPSRSAATRWARLGAAAAAAADTRLTKICYQNAKDLSALLLFASCTGDKPLLKEVASTADAEGKDNIAFLSFFMLNEPQTCLDMLLTRKRFPEAALFARSYLPSQVPDAVQRWRDSLGADTKASQSLADPVGYENLFPEIQESLQLERFQAEIAHNASNLKLIEPDAKLCNTERDLKEEQKRLQPHLLSQSANHISNPKEAKGGSSAATATTSRSNLATPTSYFHTPPSCSNNPGGRSLGATFRSPIAPNLNSSFCTDSPQYFYSPLPCTSVSDERNLPLYLDSPCSADPKGSSRQTLVPPEECLNPPPGVSVSDERNLPLYLDSPCSADPKGSSRQTLGSPEECFNTPPPIASVSDERNLPPYSDSPCSDDPKESSRQTLVSPGECFYTPPPIALVSDERNLPPYSDSPCSDDPKESSRQTLVSPGECFYTPPPIALVSDERNLPPYSDSPCSDDPKESSRQTLVSPGECFYTPPPIALVSDERNLPPYSDSPCSDDPKGSSRQTLVSPGECFYTPPPIALVSDERNLPPYSDSPCSDDPKGSSRQTLVSPGECFYTPPPGASVSDERNLPRHSYSPCSNGPKGSSHEAVLDNSISPNEAIGDLYSPTCNNLDVSLSFNSPPPATHDSDERNFGSPSRNLEEDVNSPPVVGCLTPTTVTTRQADVPPAQGIISLPPRIDDPDEGNPKSSGASSEQLETPTSAANRKYSLAIDDIYQELKGLGIDVNADDADLGDDADADLLD